MERFPIKYRLTGKALPPRPIRMSIPGWGGPEGEKKNGLEPRPWHCPPFVEAAIYGLELIYQYETECQVINENGEIRFEWDYANEPDVKLGGEEFAAFFPRPAKYYLFSTALDLQAPPGHVLRTMPHPRYFTDDTGTVPLSMMGHVQSEWWSKTLFVVFRVPQPGQRHIFRKGEPYVQILFVPQHVQYDALPMNAEEEAERRELERGISTSASFIANNVWNNPAGHEFKDHYKVMGRAFAVDGMAGVKQIVQEAGERLQKCLPRDKSIAQCLNMGYEQQMAGNFVEARTIYQHVVSRDPQNAEAWMRLGIVAACVEAPLDAIDLMKRAIAIRPQWPYYHANLGETLRRAGRYDEAEASLRASLQINPKNPDALSNLGVCLAHQGRADEALQACRAALAVAQPSPILHHRMGLALGLIGKPNDARASHEKALALDPGYADAKRAIGALQPRSPEPTS